MLRVCLPGTAYPTATVRGTRAPSCCPSTQRLGVGDRPHSPRTGFPSGHMTTAGPPMGPLTAAQLPWRPAGRHPGPGRAARKPDPSHSPDPLLKGWGGRGCLAPAGACEHPAGSASLRSAVRAPGGRPVGACPHCGVLSFQPDEVQAATRRVGNPAKPRIGEPLPVFASCAHVGPGGGDPDGHPRWWREDTPPSPSTVS